MAEIIGGIIIILTLIVFTILILRPGGGRKRRDDRDAKKSTELMENPAALYESQQAADLQVGEDRERRQPSRFAPDVKVRPQRRESRFPKQAVGKR